MIFKHYYHTGTDHEINERFYKNKCCLFGNWYRCETVQFEEIK